MQARGAQLARFALFMEYKRKLLPRRDIVATRKDSFLPQLTLVFPDNPRALNAVVNSASRQLQDIFGMELVEHRSRMNFGRKAQRIGKGKEKELDGEGNDESNEADKTKGALRPPPGAHSRLLDLWSEVDSADRAYSTDE